MDRQTLPPRNQGYSAAILHAVEEAQALNLWPKDDFDLLRRVYTGATGQKDLVRRISQTTKKEKLKQDQIAFLIAVAAHAGQSRKSGGPYIQHPLRIAFSFAGHETNHRAVALLHDVVEDCPGWNQAALQTCGIKRKNCHSVQCLTKHPKEAAPSYFGRVKRDRVATNVKIQDLLDNSDLRRWIAAGYLTEDGEPRTDLPPEKEKIAKERKAKHAWYAEKVGELMNHRTKRRWAAAEMRCA